MKNYVTPLIVVMLLILGSVAGVQSFKLNRQKEKVSALVADLEKTSEHTQQVEAAHAVLENERRELLRQIHELKTNPPALEPGSSVANSTLAHTRSTPNQRMPADDKVPALRGFMAKMMEDPEMRGFLRDQQRQLLDPLYQPLVNRLGLTTEEAEAFKDFVADTQIGSAQQASALLGKSPDERAEAMQALSAEQTDYNAQIREFLGEDGYALYEDYQQTLGERAQLQQFKILNSSSEHPLTDEQTEWLLTLMKEEKQALAATTGQALLGNPQDPGNLQAMLSAESTEQFLEMQTAANQRVYQRAADGLLTDQLEAFGKFQTNQLQLMRMGMSMARQMFESEPAAGRN